MTMEDLEPRRGQDQTLRDLLREDLDAYSVEDLEARAESLRAEIVRTEAAVHAKLQKKSAADAFFRLGDGA